MIWYFNTRSFLIPDQLKSWDGMSQLSQITVMFVVNFKKSFKVIVEPRLNKIS